MPGSLFGINKLGTLSGILLKSHDFKSKPYISARMRRWSKIGSHAINSFLLWLRNIGHWYNISFSIPYPFFLLWLLMWYGNINFSGFIIVVNIILDFRLWRRNP